jgi:hypothetical protein
MPSETTYTSLRENLAGVLDRVVDQQETVTETESARQAYSSVRLERARRLARSAPTSVTTMRSPS